jgi:membrane fusion protein (multidrug efflux system)
MKCVLLACAVLLASCGAKPPSPPAPPLVGTMTAAPALGLVPVVSYVGTLAGEVELDLAFKLAGRIAAIGPEVGRDWREGDVVAIGTALASLDPAQLVETVRAVEARASNDAGLHERGLRLMADQLISQQELDKLAAARDTSAADLRRAQAALADAVINAPFAGTVLRRGARTGETVAVGQMVLRLADLSRMSVELGVPEHIVGRLKPGQELALTLPAFPGQAFRGLVSEVGASAASGSRLFQMRVAVANPDGRLRPGMSATVAIPGDLPPADAVTVPLSALLAGPDGRAFRVMVVEGAVARGRPVEVIDVIGSSAVISRGLAVGEAVVVAGTGLCADGQPVMARPHDPDAIYQRP